MNAEKRTIAVFGGYGPAPGEPDYEAARELGRLIASNGWTLMNGGYGGTMEASARGAKEAGGHVIGVPVETFSRTPNEFTDDTVVTRDLWERLKVLTSRPHAFVALPGATGTLAEIAMVWELMGKKLMDPKPFLLHTFWRPVYEILVPAPDARTACGGMVRLFSEPAEAVSLVKTLFGE